MNNIGEIMKAMDKKTKKRLQIGALYVVGGLLFMGTACAASDLGEMATKITATFGAIGKLITGVSYVAGLGFAIGAILKFKQHKDNPTQVEIGKPITLLLVAGSLLFMPALLSSVGTTMFGAGAKTAGASGTTIGGT